MRTFEQQIIELKAQGPVDPQKALELFDQLEPVQLEALIGQWKGEEFPSGHQMDGRLAQSGWYGKTFHDKEHVDPLVFTGADGKLFAVDPVKAMTGIELTAAQGSKARIRMVEHRGVVTGTMIYDDLAIYDHFRAITKDFLMGVMDLKGVEAPYFFLLRRV